MLFSTVMVGYFLAICNCRELTNVYELVVEIFVVIKCENCLDLELFGECELWVGLFR